MQTGYIVFAFPFVHSYVRLFVSSVEFASKFWLNMRGSRNFHERGSNENGNFWSQTRGGVQPPKKIPKLPFFR